ncbi:hypothetical protein [Halogranum gelatinilyticum]|nr:hypothetical protein [Halogranum gelatinilyticum]
MSTDSQRGYESVLGLFLASRRQPPRPWEAPASRAAVIRSQSLLPSADP